MTQFIQAYIGQQYQQAMWYTNRPCEISLVTLKSHINGERLHKLIDNQKIDGNNF